MGRLQDMTIQPMWDPELDFETEKTHQWKSGYIS